ncbi:hypothetical protein SNE25_10725 [Mucilaginibacter sabulilitoris]|uniref:DUF922 domain-containing protein n=1 Tax=Mucilaginibacter sabulilitoris TaxID=1173583 RepID=A0ABZ0TU38_9SPHI|nr:hypothetical protein [Mucilaginibacter sabulilitoris]WPU95992.1 hypothetical protein SNE25_10725 [Mucilaginibacter sabulilitoris]
MVYCVPLMFVLMGRFSKRLQLFGISWLFVFLFFPMALKAQKTAPPIALNNERLPVQPREFYIAAVIDERADRGAVAWLLPTSGTVSTTPLYRLDLKDGAQATVMQFVNYSIPPNKTLRPVIIRIKKLKLTESLQADGRVEGKMEALLSFDLKRVYDSNHLIDYRTTSTYYRTTAQQYDTEPLFRNVLQAGLVYFNTWINREANTNIKLAKGVKVTFSDYTEQPEGDTIYYSVQRPLRWDDFKAAPIGEKYEASVLPSIGYNERVEIVNGIINVNLAIKTFLPKSTAWVRSGGNNTYSLNHEQRHFDIVKIIAERFKQKIRSEKLPVDNYDGYINVYYLEAFHEMNVMQDEYDNETSHGINQMAQQQWNEKIDKELGRFKP